MKARKNLPKTALPRIYRIDEMIASGRYPSTKQMAREYETSMSSISRDIYFMKYSLGAPIEYDTLLLESCISFQENFFKFNVSLKHLPKHAISVVLTNNCST